MLGQEAFQLASHKLDERLDKIKGVLEKAAEAGCFSVEVPLDAEFGSPSWWWEPANQDRVGDYLTSLGCHCKFRNPRVDNSPYPSLFVDWFDEAQVAALINAEHKRYAEEQKRGSSKRWATEQFAVQVADSCPELEIDPSKCDGAAGVLHVRAKGPIVFNLAVRPGENVAALTVVVEEWTGLQHVISRDAAGNEEHLDVSSSTSESGTLTVGFDHPEALQGWQEIRFE